MPTMEQETFSHVHQSVTVLWNTEHRIRLPGSMFYKIIISQKKKFIYVDDFSK